MNVARPLVRAVDTETTSPSPSNTSAVDGSRQLPNNKGAPGESIEFRAGGASKQASKSAAAAGALDILGSIAA